MNNTTITQQIKRHITAENILDELVYAYTHNNYKQIKYISRCLNYGQFNITNIQLLLDTFQSACKNGDFRIIRCLIKYICNINNFNLYNFFYSIFETVCSSGYTHISKYIIHKCEKYNIKIDINYNNEYIFCNTFHRDHIQTIIYLLYLKKHNYYSSNLFFFNIKLVDRHIIIKQTNIRIFNDYILFNSDIFFTRKKINTCIYKIYNSCDNYSHKQKYIVNNNIICGNCKTTVINMNTSYIFFFVI